MEIPVIDLDDQTEEELGLLSKLYNACQNTGFFYVKTERIDAALVEEMFQLSQDFFQLPTEEKQLFPIIDNRGYTALKQETLDPDVQIEGDTKECFNFKQISPDQELPALFKEKFEKIKLFEEQCHSLCVFLLGLVSECLEISPDSEDYLPSLHVYDPERMSDVIRFLKYPRISALEECKDPANRAGSHTDYGTITLLFQHDLPGLELLYNDVWYPVPVRTDCILVNIADLLKVMVRGLFPSTFHRVVGVEEQLTSDRYSIAYFCHPNSDWLVKALDSPAIRNRLPLEEELGNRTADDFLRWRLSNTYAEGKY